MTNKEYILDAIRKGVSPEKLAEEFTASLNAAQEQYDKEQEAEKAKKVQVSIVNEKAEKLREVFVSFTRAYLEAEEYGSEEEINAIIDDILKDPEFTSVMTGTIMYYAVGLGLISKIDKSKKSKNNNVKVETDELLKGLENILDIFKL